MTTASAYVASFVAEAARFPPSITVTTIQRNDAPSGQEHWKPGIVSYGWGVNGRVAAENPRALRFRLTTWFSDRCANPAARPPAWQQFAAEDADEQVITLTPAYVDVVASVELRRTRTGFSVPSFAYEPNSRQLLFSVPGAGPRAPRAVMIVSLHATGHLEWS